jgi:hypothetical protein
MTYVGTKTSAVRNRPHSRERRAVHCRSSSRNEELRSSALACRVGNIGEGADAVWIAAHGWGVTALDIVADRSATRDASCPDAGVTPQSVCARAIARWFA